MLVWCVLVYDVLVLIVLVAKGVHTILDLKYEIGTTRTYHYLDTSFTAALSGLQNLHMSGRIERGFTCASNPPRVIVSGFGHGGSQTPNDRRKPDDHG